ncbi:MAG: hypothetical protein FWH10_04740 [Oscillospiraceae bacterium]|nr:hypothetical protein [Oscillospiraceae bacterium]
MDAANEVNRKLNIRRKKNMVKVNKPEIPNEETRRVFEDTDRGIGLNRCDSLEQLFRELKEE